MGYILLVVYIFVIMLILPVYHIETIRIVGAPTVAVFISWRIVPALILGLSPLLNEKLSVYNFIGVAIVFLVSTVYMYTRYQDLKPKPKPKDDTEKNGEDLEENLLTPQSGPNSTAGTSLPKSSTEKLSVGLKDISNGENAEIKKKLLEL